MNVIVAFLLILLLMSVESSLQTSVIWDRGDAWWTPWLYKTGPFSAADIFIIIVTVVTLINVLKQYIRKENPFFYAKYLPLCVLVSVYLMIGFVYNLTVYAFWKTFLYDLKAVLYLTIPYFFLRSIGGNAERIRRWFLPERIFIYCAAGALIDLAVVGVFGKIEYPRYLGLPVIPNILPAIVCIAGFAYARSNRLKAFFAAILLFDCLNAVNRLSLGYVFSVGVGLAYFTVIRTRMKTTAKYFLVLATFLAIFFFHLWAVYNPFGILQQKSDGVLTRAGQFQNVLMNFDHNLPIFIGKGLGSTWFEYTQISKDDIYSVGTSVGRDQYEAMAGPVKFVFNFTPAGILYKWGILGTLILVSMIFLYFQGMYKKISWLNVRNMCTQEDARYLAAVLCMLFVFMETHFTYVGMLKGSLITSLLAFYMDNRMGEYAKKAVLLYEEEKV